MKKGDLEDHIALQATSWLPLSPKKYLDPFTVDIDRKRVEAYYAAHGYFFAHVTEATVIPRGTDGKSVDVKLVVDEGPPTVIDKVVIHGLEPLSAKEGPALQKLLEKPFGHGKVFVHETYLERKAIAETKLQRLGYAWGTVTGEVDVNRDKRTADIIFNVSAGPRATMGTVYVRGYETIDPRLILARAQIDKGAKFNSDLLEDARGRIYNTGAFGS
ncbi:MAG TPA: POTRA domain-containing protein, partial [Polyangiaceae bacterium]|nr:POTRA domain-containing protein [Polyangiaceae bacterium]